MILKAVKQVLAPAPVQHLIRIALLLLGPLSTGICLEFIYCKSSLALKALACLKPAGHCSAAEDALHALHPAVPSIQALQQLHGSDPDLLQPGPNAGILVRRCCRRSSSSWDKWHDEAMWQMPTWDTAASGFSAFSSRFNRSQHCQGSQPITSAKRSILFTRRSVELHAKPEHQKASAICWNYLKTEVWLVSYCLLSSRGTTAWRWHG